MAISWCYYVKLHCVHLTLSFLLDVLKEFELVLTRNKTKNEKNIVIQRKYKKYSIFIGNVDISKKLGRQYNLFLDQSANFEGE